MSLPILSDSIQAYIVEVNRFPLLSSSEEQRLALRYYEKKDLDAAHKLVTSNLRFVVKTAYEYRQYGVSIKDLIQEGNIGLMTAVKKFNPHKGNRLITYAVWWIKSRMQEHILKTTGIVKRGTRALKKKLFYKSIETDSGQLTAANEDLGHPEVTTWDFSLDAPLDDHNAMTYMDGLVDESADQAELASNNQEDALVKSSVTSALAVLNKRELAVIRKRTMAEEPMSLHLLGIELGISRERVRQIESAAMKKLKAVLGNSPAIAGVLPATTCDNLS
ncbi:RNA polymerase sigma factor RpoH [hydrothermal vent metagenome]|uniref:RNA polymerase sigma factor RpoH n=1 Tax=hydrothermal vent metagenome TaxID=652676 RepID=A0A3B0QVH8_9ZZZZ